MKAEAIKTYQDLRDMRSRLEKKVAEIKEAENKIKAEILAELDAQGLDAIKEGGYTISRKHTVRAEVADHNALQEVMFALMVQAKREGRPLQDGLLLQRTVSKTAVIALIRSRLGLADDDDLKVTAPEVIALANKLGVRLVDDLGLNIRKAK